jgi:hypothetical protein
MKVFLATTNSGKIERFSKLLKEVSKDIEIYTPQDLGLDIDVPETGNTLLENAKLKAYAYLGKTDLSILSNDTGFYVEGEGFTDAPKRHALQGQDEHELSKEEISKRLMSFWKSIATKYGGKVDAAWIEAFVLLKPDGTLNYAESRREVLLTDQEFGIPPLQMPVRALYYSKATNKPAIQHTHEEEVVEMKPVIDALAHVLEV